MASCGIHVCKQCHKEYKRNADLRRHIRRDHERVRKYECDFCHRSFHLKNNWEAHCKVHEKRHSVVSSENETEIECHSLYRPGINLECRGCRQVFDSHGTFIEHMHKEHDIIRPYQCTACDRCYKARDSLIAHIEEKHVGKVNYECDSCHKTFYHTADWKKHVAYHQRENKVKSIDSIPSSLMKDKKCSICLNAKEQDIAGISCCKHSFHFDCIKQWSQVLSRSISQRNHSRKLISEFLICLISALFMNETDRESLSILQALV